jgi:acetyltransferase-like isoleucine patch superfamily enzyme
MVFTKRDVDDYCVVVGNDASFSEIGAELTVPTWSVE